MPTPDPILSSDPGSIGVDGAPGGSGTGGDGTPGSGGIIDSNGDGIPDPSPATGGSGTTDGTTAGGPTSGPDGLAANGSTDSAGPGDRPGPSSAPGAILGGSAGDGGDGTSPGGDSTTGGSGIGPDGGSGESHYWGSFAAGLDLLGVDTKSTTLALLPTLFGTSTAVGMALAFAIFGKKRRDEEPPAPDEVLQAKAAHGSGVAASGSLVGPAAVPAPFDAEAGMPRWRRPSLLEARKADPTRYVATAHRLAFVDPVDAIEGRVRRLIRYRVVRLLDAPDELRSSDIGQLDQGDEVQLMERSGAYWLVLCPDGRQGWVHKMTLGDVIGEAPSPSAAEAWGANEADGEMLTAFLAARARA
jgi:hypothetical protein